MAATAFRLRALNTYRSQRACVGKVVVKSEKCVATLSFSQLVLSKSS